MRDCAAMRFPVFLVLTRRARTGIPERILSHRATSDDKF